MHGNILCDKCKIILREEQGLETSAIDMILHEK
jgi:hypothetical protein